MKIPIVSQDNEIKIPPHVQYAIGVDGINVKILPAGTSPNVIYRIGDGTVHPEGWDNVDGDKYLDFYISTGAEGAKGDKGDAGASAYSQAVDNGYTGTEAEFYQLLTDVTDNAISADASATASALSATESANSATASANSASASASSATQSANSTTQSASSATSSANSATASESSASSASASATASSNSATASATSASNASISEINASTSATEAQLKAWEAEAEELTANSYAVEPITEFVKVYTSNDDGTFTATPTTDRSALYWANYAESFDPDQYKQATPTLSGNATVTETNQLAITITNYDSDATYEISSITTATEVSIVGDTITILADSVTVDTAGEVRVVARKTGYLTSEEAIFSFTVLNQTIQDDLDYAINVSGATFNATNYPTRVGSYTDNAIIATLDSTRTLDIFEDGSGINTYRLDGNAEDLGSSNGTAVGVEYVSGKFEKRSSATAVTADASYITSNKNISVSDTFTISGLYYSTLASSITPFFGTTVLATNGGFFTSLGYNTLDQLRVHLLGASAGDNVVFDCPQTGMNDGNAKHIVFSYDGITKTATIYIDKVLQGSVTNVNIVDPTNGSTDFRIIGANGGATSLGDGAEQVRILNKTVTQAEVDRLFDEAVTQATATSAVVAKADADGDWVGSQAGAYVTSQLPNRLTEGLQGGDGDVNPNTTDAVPAMTSNTTPSGVASSTTPIVGYEAYKAFDDDTSVPWAIVGAVGYIQYQFDTPKVINKYTISSGSVLLARMPKAWTIKASNTGAFSGEEVILDSASNISWSASQVLSVGFVNDVPYSYYRIDIIENNGDSNTNIAQIEFIEAQYTQKATSIEILVQDQVTNGDVLYVGDASNIDEVTASGVTYYPLEAVTNGTFDTDVSNWNTANLPTITWSSGRALVARNSGDYTDLPTQQLSFIVGEEVTISADFFNATGITSLKIRDNANTLDLVDATGGATGDGTLTATWTVTEENPLILLGVSSGSTTAEFDNVSVTRANDLSKLAHNQAYTPTFALTKDNVNVDLTSNYIDVDSKDVLVSADATDIIVDGQVTDGDAVLVSDLGSNVNEIVTSGSEYYDPSDTSDPNLVALYEANGNANDTTGTYNGTPTNITYTDGIVGQSFSFNGSTSKVVLPIFSANSISFWFRANSFTSIPCLYEGRVTGCLGAYLALGTSGNLQFFSGSASNTSVTSPLTAGEWYHVVLAYDNTTWRLYLDNVLIYSVDDSRSTIRPTHYIGTYDTGSLYTLDGSIDQVVFYSSEADQTKVTELYNVGKSKLPHGQAYVPTYATTDSANFADISTNILGTNFETIVKGTTPETIKVNTEDTHDVFGDGSAVATYQLDDAFTNNASGENAVDLGGTYTGTAYNVTSGTGKFGQAGVFNGSSSYIDTNNNFSSIITHNSDFTMSVWAKPTTLGVHNGIFEKSRYSNSTDNDVFRLSIGSGNNIVTWYLADNYGSTGNQYSIGTHTAIINEWVYITLRYENNTATIFINGVENASQSVTWDWSNSNDLGIGCRFQNSTALDYWFNGSIDQIRIFNRALTSTEVEALYLEDVVKVKEVFNELTLANTGTQLQHKAKAKEADTVIEDIQIGLREEI